MKTIMLACCAAGLLMSCGAAKAQRARILSQLGKNDYALIDEVQARNAGSLCSIVVDGHARLMSFGQQAVVDIDGRATLLSYHPSPRGDEANFMGAGIRVSGNLARHEVTDPGSTISRDVNVGIRAPRRAEHLQAKWTCQSHELMKVQMVH